MWKCSWARQNSSKWAWQRLAGQQPPSDMWMGGLHEALLPLWSQSKSAVNLPSGATISRVCRELCQKEKTSSEGQLCVDLRSKTSWRPLVTTLESRWPPWVGNTTFSCWKCCKHTALPTLKTWKHPHWPLYWEHSTNMVSDPIKENHFENTQIHFNWKWGWSL